MGARAGGGKGWATRFSQADRNGLAAVRAHWNSSVYSLTKAGLISLARTLSGELLQRGVRLNGKRRLIPL